MISACVVSASAKFTDVSNSKHETAIESLAELKLVLGTGNNKFGTGEDVTRQQMALFVARLKSGLAVTGSPGSENTSPFTDLVNSTYNKAISYCYQNGIIYGKSATRFDPTGSVLVKEAITMAVRTLGYTNLKNYPDDYIKKARECGLLNNLVDVDFNRNMKREEVAQLIYNTLYSNGLKDNDKALFDLYFSSNDNLDYFEITTLTELAANYDYEQLTYPNGNVRYIIRDAQLFGYTGDLHYAFHDNEIDPCKCTIYFEFPIKGYREPQGASFRVVDSSTKMSPSEARNLIESVNRSAARYIGLDANMDARTSSIKEGAPANIYEAAAKNYLKINYDYKEDNGNMWNLMIHTPVTTGCLFGRLTYDVLRKNA